MKKTYLQPATTVVSVAPVLMTVTSGFNSSLNNDPVDGSDALGRRGGNYDWEDED